MKNYKNIFPFKIGTTSYILHVKENNIIKNIEYLKNSFDKIQLLFFGKNYLNVFLNSLILNNLHKIKNESLVEYSIHLPIDLELLNNSPKKIQKSLDVIFKIIEKTEFLDIKEYILHIDKNKKEVKLNKTNFKIFNEVCKAIKERISETNLFYIENVNYDLTYFKDIIFEYGYSICFDIGHLFYYKYDFDFFIKTFNHLINEIHVHGLKNGKDHLSLDKLENKFSKKIIKYLTNYKKSVTIEVFNKSNLNKSLKFFKKNFRKDKYGIKRIN